MTCFALNRSRVRCAYLNTAAYRQLRTSRAGAAKDVCVGLWRFRHIFTPFGEFLVCLGSHAGANTREMLCGCETAAVCVDHVILAHQDSAPVPRSVVVFPTLLCYSSCPETWSRATSPVPKATEIFFDEWPLSIFDIPGAHLKPAAYGGSFAGESILLGAAVF